MHDSHIMPAEPYIFFAVYDMSDSQCGLVACPLPRHGWRLYQRASCHAEIGAGEWRGTSSRTGTAISGMDSPLCKE